MLCKMTRSKCYLFWSFKDSVDGMTPAKVHMIGIEIVEERRPVTQGQVRITH